MDEMNWRVFGPGRYVVIVLSVSRSNAKEEGLETTLQLSIPLPPSPGWVALGMG